MDKNKNLYFINRILNLIKKRKKKAELDILKGTLDRIRTDTWSQVSDKELITICENYRLEGTDLLEAVSFLYRIAFELEKVVKDRNYAKTKKKTNKESKKENEES